MAQNFLKILYAYRFENGMTIKFDLLLDHATLALSMEKQEKPADWTLLRNNKCKICPLDESTHPHCPVAAHLSSVVEKFSKFVSHDKVSVACVVEERTYRRTRPCKWA